MTLMPSRLLAACALCGLVAAPLQSAPPIDAKPARNAAKRTTVQLAMLDGQWSGPAWVIAPDGKKYELEQVETVCPALFGEVRVMEGRGSIGALTRFHAVTIFEGKSDGTIAMRSYTPGRTGDYQLTLTGDGFEWGFAAGAATYRYRIIIDGDRWTEIGETRAGPDAKWSQIFGMELRRVTGAANVTGCITPIGPAAQEVAR